MTLRQSLVLLAVLFVAAVSEARAQDIEISIETIESDQFISGFVRGLEEAEIPRHRVVAGGLSGGRLPDDGQAQRGAAGLPGRRRRGQALNGSGA